jgi:hypothetical protein
MDKRTPRESDNREATSRKKSWAPPTVLPEPEKKDGWRYRWVRTSTLNSSDNTNVSSKFRQGWEPVKAEEHPEITVLRDRNSDFKDNIEVGGLLLCKAPEETMTAQNQMVSVENNFMRENDPRMPLSKPEITTRVTFGKGRG